MFAKCCFCCPSLFIREEEFEPDANDECNNLFGIKNSPSKKRSSAASLWKQCLQNGLLRRRNKREVDFPGTSPKFISLSPISGLTYQSLRTKKWSKSYVKSSWMNETRVLPKRERDFLRDPNAVSVLCRRYESGGSGTAINQTGGIGSSSIGGHGGADSLLNASPGAYSSPSDPTLPLSAPLERMSTDIHALKKQYSKLQQRMQQVHVIYYGGRTSADGSVSEKPVEVVNPMKTNLAINHLFVVNKDQTTSQLPVLPPQSTSPTPSATGPGANSNATTDTTGAWGMSGCVGYNSCSSQAVNHLTIKPYIPHASTLDPLASSPLPCPCPPHASSSPAPSESSAGGGAPLTSNSSSLSPLSSKNNSTSHSHHPTSRSTAAVAASQRRRKSQQTQSASTSPRSTCSSPGGQAVLYPRKRSEAGASTIDSLDVDEEGVGGGFGAIGDDIVLPPVDTLSCSFCLNNNSQPHSETTPTTDCCSCSTRTWPTPSSCDTTEDATTAASAHSFSFSPTEFTSPPATPPTGSCSSTSFSSPSSRAAASKNVYRKAPLKPNIRPNLGSNDRPRIYNPFPVNYVHNTKLRKGKSLGLYCQSSTAQSSNSSTSSNKLNTGGSGGASTASDGVLARLGLK